MPLLLVTRTGACRFRYAEPRQRKTLAYRRLYFSEPVVFFVLPDKVTTKKATRLGDIRGDLIGTRTRVCAVRGRRPNR